MRRREEPHVLSAWKFLTSETGGVKLIIAIGLFSLLLCSGLTQSLAAGLFPLQVAFEQVSFKAEDGYSESGLLLSVGSTSTIGIILVHGGFQQDYEGENFFSKIPSLLAAKGYAVLELNMRRGSSFATSIFEDGVKDIRAAIRFMSSRGISSILLAGHTNGAGEVAYYVSSTKDNAVIALGLYSPAGTWKWIFRYNLGKEYDTISKQAQKLIDAGQGTTRVYTISCSKSSANYFYCSTGMQGQDISAQTWLSWFGSESNYTISNIQSVSVPVLVMVHQSDTNVLPWAKWYYGNATQSVKRYLNIYTTATTGNPHYFQGVENQVVQDTVSWLNGLPEPVSSIRPIFQVQAVGRCSNSRVCL